MADDYKREIAFPGEEFAAIRASKAEYNDPVQRSVRTLKGLLLAGGIVP
jgi:hypothetical protein